MLQTRSKQRQKRKQKLKTHTGASKQAQAHRGKRAIAHTGGKRAHTYTGATRQGQCQSRGRRQCCRQGQSRGRSESKDKDKVLTEDQAKVVAEANKTKAEASEGYSCTRRNQQRAGTFSHPGCKRAHLVPRLSVGENVICTGWS